MILDNEAHRELLLDLLNAVNFKGADLDLIYSLKNSIVNATVGTLQAESAEIEPLPKRSRKK